MNPLLSWIQADREKWGFFIAEAYDPTTEHEASEWGSRPPFSQRMSEGTWRDAVDGALRPDFELGVAEGEGRASNWHEALLIGSEMRLILPNDSSHLSRVMLFGPVEVQYRVSGGERLRLQGVQAVAAPLPPEVEEDQVVDAFKGGLIRRTWRRLRRQSCIGGRVPGSCIPVHCDGVCRPYLISDGPKDRLLCTCT